MFLFLLFSPSRGKNLLTSTPLCLWTKPRDTSSFSKNLRRTSVSSRVMTKSPSNLTGKVLCSLLLATVSRPPPKANYSFYVSKLSFVTLYHAKLPGHLDSTAGVCPEVQGALISQLEIWWPFVVWTLVFPPYEPFPAALWASLGRSASPELRFLSSKENVPGETMQKLLVFQAKPPNYTVKHGASI